MFKTSIIIPCYWLNQDLVEMTARCIDSLEFGRPDEVIVVNDGSPVRYYPENCIVADRKSNGGYAKAVNTGLKRATGDIIIIANNDLEFGPGWLEGLLKPLYEEYDISSVRTSDQTWETESKITTGDKFGSLWAMKREVYDKIGGLDIEFGKGYFEDLDYQKRAEAKGFKVGKNHAVVVKHEGKATFKEVDPQDKQYYKSMGIYKKKHGKVD